MPLLVSAHMNSLALTTDNDNMDTGANVTQLPPQLWVTPVPNWNTSIPVWGAAWPFHTYFFGSAFTILMIVALVLLCGAMGNRRLRTRYRGLGKQRKRRLPKSLLPPPVFSLLVFAAFLRALCLFADPYHSTKVLPAALARTFGNLPFTAFLCAYQLLFLALHSALRIEVGTLQWLAKRWLIFGVVAFFMVFNTAVDLILVLGVKFRPLLILCMVANCIWILILVAEFIMNAIRLRARIVSTQKSLTPRLGPAMKALAVSGMAAAAAGSPKQAAEDPSTLIRGFRNSARKLKRRLTSSSIFKKKENMKKSLSLQRRILRMTVVLLVTLVVYFGFLFYYLLGVTGATSFESLIKPWTWYTVTTCYRISELALSSAILIMLTQSQKKKSMPADVTDSNRLSSMRPTNSGTSMSESHSNGNLAARRRNPSVIPEEEHEEERVESTGDAIGDLPAVFFYFRSNTLMITSL